MTRLPERLAAISARLELEQTDSFHEGLTLGLGRPYKLINSSFDLHQTTHHDPDTLFDMPVETCWTPQRHDGEPCLFAAQSRCQDLVVERTTGTCDRQRRKALVSFV